MTKTYEALENAQRGRAAGGRAPGRSTAPKSVESTLLSLYQRIDGAPGAAHGGRAIGFADAQGSTDAAVLLVQLARLAAQRLNKRVLIAAPTSASYVMRTFSATGPQGWEGVLAGTQSLGDVVHAPGDGAIAVTQLALGEAGLPSVLASTAFRSNLDQLRAQYNLILVDAPSLNATADLALLAASLDGVVVVAEAGKSRRQAVKRAVDQVQAQGGQVLGVVLNRRKYYIPAFLYNRL